MNPILSQVIRNRLLLPVLLSLFATAPISAQEVDEAPIGEAVERHLSLDEPFTQWMQDPERFEAIITSETCPVQIIFAGKAHPKDNDGKELIKRIVNFARKPNLRHRVIFLEDYDMQMARYLVQGADVWLNTPRRPFEACGTSGMKAAINGVLNVSILDGWWCEGYSKERGWSIGKGEEYTDTNYQDVIESQALYNILENDVIPCFYERGSGKASTRWIKMMKESIKMAMLRFSGRAMVGEYEKRFYLPAAKRLHSLIANDAAEAKSLAAQHERLSALWGNIKIQSPVRKSEGPFRVGGSFRVTSVVHLGELLPVEVEVQLCYGPLQSVDTLAPVQTEEMIMQEDLGEGEYMYTCTLTCRNSGRYGFTARVTPRGDDQLKFTPGLITWA